MTTLFPQDLWIWVILGLGVMLVGFSKTGIPGVGILFIAIFANVFPARLSTGIVLPMLIVGDLIAVRRFQRKTVWSHVWRLIPPSLAGVIVGYYTLKSLTDSAAGLWIGILILAMVFLHFIRKSFPDWKPHQNGVALFFGFTGGVVTMIANASGPLVTLYLLEMKLSKEEFMGTGAWFYLIMNCIKVPFGISLGIIDSQSLLLNLVLLPFLAIGTWIGVRIQSRISQSWFEGAAIAFTTMAAIRLIWDHLP